MAYIQFFDTVFTFKALAPSNTLLALLKVMPDIFTRRRVLAFCLTC